MILGLALAVACALATSVSFLLKQRGAVSAPRCAVGTRFEAPPGSFAPGGSRWAGWWRSEPGRFTSAPSPSHRCPVVQAVLSAGLVFLAVLAERFFGFRLGRRQWTGVESSRRWDSRSSGLPKGRNPASLRATHWPP